jgi:hypothetical protein
MSLGKDPKELRFDDFQYVEVDQLPLEVFVTEMERCRIATKLLLYLPYGPKNQYYMVEHERHGFILPGGAVELKDIHLYHALFRKVPEVDELMRFSLMREIAEELHMSTNNLEITNHKRRFVSADPYYMLHWNYRGKPAIDFVYSMSTIFGVDHMSNMTEKGINGARWVTAEEVLNSSNTPVNSKLVILRAENQISIYGKTRSGNILLPDLENSFTALYAEDYDMWANVYDQAGVN